MPKLYGSVLGLSKEIKKLYGPLYTELFNATPDGVIIQSIDGVTLCSGLKNKIPSTYSNTASVKILYQNSGVVYLTAYDANNTQLVEFSTSQNNIQNTYGITFTPSVAAHSEITFAATYSQGTETKRIVKIYGSVNGSAKLIYEDNS